MQPCLSSEGTAGLPYHIGNLTLGRLRLAPTSSYFPMLGAKKRETCSVFIRFSLTNLIRVKITRLQIPTYRLCVCVWVANTFVQWNFSEARTTGRNWRVITIVHLMQLGNVILGGDDFTSLCNARYTPDPEYHYLRAHVQGKDFILCVCVWVGEHVGKFQDKTRYTYLFLWHGNCHWFVVMWLCVRSVRYVVSFFAFSLFLYNYWTLVLKYKWYLG